MKKNLAFVLLFFSSTAYSHNFFLTKDSLYRYPNYIKEGWKFSPGDDSTMSLLSYNDNSWREEQTTLNITDTSKTVFNGVGWFRLHFSADTTVVGTPLALTMSHFGASQVYIDGKVIKSFGTINGADSSEYYDPREVPFIFTVKEAGEHVIAVRYANYNAEKNFKTYGHSSAGFEMMIGMADYYILIKNQRSTVLSFMLMMLGGIFLAFCVIHLFLYFYHRADRSNLFFSIFMLCIAFLFIIGFIGYSSTSPSLVLKSVFMINPVILIACISLSGFIKEIFLKKNWRFLVIVLAATVSFLMQLLRVPVYAYLTMGLIISVSFEAVFTTIFGMIKRIKGSYIIGTGVLFFTLFILALYVMAMASGGNFDINGSTVGGIIWEFFLALAVISIPVSMSLYQAWRFASVNKDLNLQLEQVQMLSQKTLEQELEKKKILESQKEKLEEEVTLRTAELRTEKKKSDDLLLNILPLEVADELKEKGNADARHFDEVTVMFTDFKNFTTVAEKLSPQQLVNEINYCYSEFDKIVSKYGIEKIKTIGDAYMCAGGLPVANKTNALDILAAAIEIRDFMLAEKRKRETESKPFFEIRIGCNTGPVVAGIVGIKKFAYDIWGDSVNIAARMESTGEPGKINISGSTYELVKHKFNCVYRGKIQAKNKGEIDMYFVEPIFSEV